VAKKKRRSKDTNRGDRSMTILVKHKERTVIANFLARMSLRPESLF